MKRESSRPFVVSPGPSNGAFPDTLAEFLDIADRHGYLRNDGNGNFSYVDGDFDAIVAGSLGEVGDAVTLDWTYSDEARDFELFSALFSWRDIAPIAVKEAIAGDESLDLATTEGLKLGEPYVLVGADGTLIETIEVSRILTGKRLRARLPLSNSVAEADGVTLARTSAEVRERSAVFSDGDVYYSSVLDALRVQDDGRLYIRRSADGTGTFKIEFRDEDDDLPWTTAPLIDIRSRVPETRDEEYRIGLGGLVKVRITYAGADGNDRESVSHIVLGPAPRAQAADFVERPRNVTPADQAINVGETPTLTWSPYRSLYGEDQGGAHVRVARDPEMSDLVLSTSNDWLASFVAVTGYNEDWKAIVALDVDSFSAVASGVSVVLNQAGAITGTHNVTGDLRAIDADTGLTVAAGATGAIRTLADGQTDYVIRAAGGGYNGTFEGVAVRGSRVCLVGTDGEIQFSGNGTIFSKVVADGGFAGDFHDVCADGTGRVVAVGANGTIQTSANDGESNWTAREAPGGYTGTYRAAATLPNGHGFAVGDNAALHETFDGGATWSDGNPADGFAGAFFAVAIVSIAGTEYAVATGAGGEIQTRNLSEANSQWERRATGGGAETPIRAVALDSNADVVALGDGGLVQRTFRLSGIITDFDVPAGVLAVNKIYFWDVALADDQERWSPFSKPTAFATGAIFQYVAQPRNLAPAPGDDLVSIRPTLQSSAFQPIGGADNHVSSRWQIVKDQAASVIAYDSGEITDLTQHSVPAGSELVDEKTYFFRVLHVGETFGLSAWSSLTSFKTVKRPNRPVVTSPANNAQNVSLTPTITTSSFQQLGGGSHAATQYRIRQAGVTVYDSGWVSDLTSHTLPNGSALDPLNDYVADVRHQNTEGAASDWSNANSFRTQVPAGQMVFTTAGTTVFTVPDGVTSVSVLVVGGGGGGGGGGSDANANPGNHGSPGATSSFGTFLSRAGGGAGSGFRAPLSAFRGGSGGSGGGGSTSSAGGIGGSDGSDGQGPNPGPGAGVGHFTRLNALKTPGAGGAVPAGGGGGGYDNSIKLAIDGTGTNGSAGGGRGYGAGGGGAVASGGGPGAGGGSGFGDYLNDIAVEPGQQVMVTVGDGGPGGSNGTDSGRGGKGASGIVHIL